MKSANQTIRDKPLNRRVELERFSLTTSKPLNQVVAALNATIGHPNIKEFWSQLTAQSQWLDRRASPRNLSAARD